MNPYTNPQANPNGQRRGAQSPRPSSSSPGNRPAQQPFSPVRPARRPNPNETTNMNTNRIPPRAQGRPPERYPAPGEPYRRSVPDSHGRYASTPDRVMQRNGRPTRKRTDGKKKSATSKWIIPLLNITIVACIAIAAYLLIWPMINERKAREINESIAAQLKAHPDQTFETVIGKNVGALPQEEYEKIPGFVPNERDNESDEAVVKLTYVGRLVYPKLAIDSPLANDAENYSLRFGVGIHQDFAGLLEPGLTNIFGHRFLTKGRDFNRLGEAAVGDQFYIDYNVDAMRHYYRVSDVVIIGMDDIYPKVYEEFEEKTVLLITCHPAVYGNQNERLLVYANPIEDLTEPIPTMSDE